MKIINEETLNNDFAARVEYLKEFVGFTADDAAALHAAKPVVAPLVPVVVDTVYEKLLSFSVTAKAFVPRQTGYQGAVPTKLSDLSADHPQIKFRKDFLARYLVKLVTMDYDKIASWEYLDKVGLMHTGHVGFAHRYVATCLRVFVQLILSGLTTSASKAPLRVEYLHCGLLLGYVEDILVNAVMNHPDLDNQTKTVVLRAFNKVRHFVSVFPTRV